ncbi:MAG: DinB family protein, partial [Dehalococcoidia bacterium]
LARGTTPPAEDLVGAGIGMIPADDGRPYAEALAELRQRNADLLDAVRSLPDAPNLEMQLPHPFFGPLNCLEWAGFQRVHDLDHIQHARRIIAAFPGG